MVPDYRQVPHGCRNLAVGLLVDVRRVTCGCTGQLGPDQEPRTHLNATDSIRAVIIPAVNACPAHDESQAQRRFESLTLVCPSNEVNPTCTADHERFGEVINTTTIWPIAEQESRIIARDHCSSGDIYKRCVRLRCVRLACSYIREALSSPAVQNDTLKAIIHHCAN